MSHLWLVKRESYLSSCFLSHRLSLVYLACKQALWGAMLAGREKEGELATTSLEFEYLHWKSWCKMLIGRSDMSNDVSAFGTCFSIFVYILAHFDFALTSGNLTAQSMASHREIGGGIQIPETVASSSSFSCPAIRAPWRPCSQAMACQWMITLFLVVISRLKRSNYIASKVQRNY